MTIYRIFSALVSLFFLLFSFVIFNWFQVISRTIHNDLELLVIGGILCLLVFILYSIILLGKPITTFILNNKKLLCITILFPALIFFIVLFLMSYPVMHVVNQLGDDEPVVQSKTTEDFSTPKVDFSSDNSSLVDEYEAMAKETLFRSKLNSVTDSRIALRILTERIERMNDFLKKYESQKEHPLYKKMEKILLSYRELQRRY